MSFGSAPSPYEPYRTPGPRPVDPNDSTLDMLGVLYYVYAGIVALTALAMGAFALLPALLITSAPPSGPGGPPPWFIGGVFAVAFGAVAAILVGKAVVMVFAGRALRRRRHHVLCVVGACTSLMNMPFGTALGVYALITLMKPEVKARFEPSLRGASPGPADGWSCLERPAFRRRIVKRPTLGAGLGCSTLCLRGLL